ncbi:MAG: 3-deoxy-D-manno-octulosonic acid transferase, partial [Chitinophagia bacterium]|nr:3-deoxy-D-manno-octulosonic acid transferase [Chitinophagia bacterium]
MTLLYSLLVNSYFFALKVASLFNPKAQKWVKGRQGLLQKVGEEQSKEKRKKIWIHCASLGEWEQGKPIAEALAQKAPDYAIVLTFFSPSGYEAVKAHPAISYIYYLPTDSHRNAKQFIKHINPSLVIFVKYEFWYHYLYDLYKQSIPVVLVSAIFRKSQPFFNPIVGRWYCKMLGYYAMIYVQDEASKQLLASVGCTNVQIAGDTRFDRVADAISQPKHVGIKKVADFCGNNKIIVAGSTWASDEKLLHSALNLLPIDWKLVVVPHEIDQAHIDALMKQYGNTAELYTSYTGNTNSKRVLIVNKIGMLLSVYSLGTVAWVGGGLDKGGVHNVLEPAAWGKPCFYGNIYHKYREA